MMKIVAMIILGFIFLEMWAWTNTKDLQAFCSELKPGMSLSVLSPLAENYHLDTARLARGLARRLAVQRGQQEVLFLYLPVQSISGIATCRIDFNKTEVLSSSFSPD